MQRQRDGGPLVLAHTTVIMGTEIGQPGLLIQRAGTQVQTGAVDVGDVQMETFLHAPGADGGCQHTFAAIDVINLVTGMQRLARYKGTIPRRQQQLFAVCRGLPLGFALVQKGLVSLAEFLRSRQCGAVGVRNGLVAVSQCFQFFSSHFFISFLFPTHTVSDSADSLV